MRKTVLEFVARGELAICDLGEPSLPGPDELLLETLYTGITNGTERHAFLHEHGYGGGHYPSRHGYQHVARVTAIGEDVSTFSPGDYVFYGGYVGHRGWNLVKENDLLLRLPQTVDLAYCALFGVAGVAMRSIRRMGVRSGDKVWVAGQGPIGHFTAQEARAAGAQVTVTDRLESRLSAARAAGAHFVWDAGNPDAYQKLKENGPYRFIYDCCSARNLLFDIFTNGLLAHSGTVGMMAVRDRVEYPWSLLHTTEARLETSCHFDRDDLWVLLFLVQQGLVNIKTAVSHLVSIDQAREVYDLLATNSDQLLGVIFDWS
jgi:2-desacetyl-2-hydroxyethyl bacteriochlorophyllide A dehydrogenase